MQIIQHMSDRSDGFGHVTMTERVARCPELWTWRCSCGDEQAVPAHDEATAASAVRHAMTAHNEFARLVRSEAVPML